MTGTNELSQSLSFYTGEEIPHYEEFLGYDKQLHAVSVLSYLTAIKSLKSPLVILFGVPGTGKSVFPFMVARHVSEVYEIPFSLAFVKCDELTRIEPQSKVIDSIQRIINLSEENSPSIVVFDEIEALSQPIREASRESASLTHFMRRLIAREPSRLLLIGVTNYPSAVDFSVSRLTELWSYFKPPNVETIERIIQKMLRRSDSRELAVSLQEYFEKIGFVPMQSDLIVACRSLQERATGGEDWHPSTDDLAHELAVLTNASPKNGIVQYEKDFAPLIGRAAMQQEYWNERYIKSLSGRRR
jgi:SpoVK/Ycf46/Vps4 family AAA+-type ATPase